MTQNIEKNPAKNTYIYALTTLLLISIWERVLNISKIDPESDFFELSGDAALDQILLTEMQKTIGRNLPIIRMADAPTVARCARIAEQILIPDFSTLFCLKPGSGLPIFMAHAISGNAIELLPLANRLRSSSPIYVLPPKGLEDGTPPSASVEEMSENYLTEIRRVQPNGPYLLIGYSFGGLVMLETAQRLVALGEEIALLAMLDSYPANALWPLSSILQFQARLFRHRLLLLMRMGLRGAIARLRSSREKSQRAPRHATTSADIAVSAILRRIRTATELARSTYRPRFYPGKITFFRPETRLRFPDNPAAIWAQRAREFELHTLPGDHAGLIGAEVEATAERLSEILNKVAKT